MITEFSKMLANFVWEGGSNLFFGFPALVIFLLASGIIFTVAFRFIQIRKFKHSIDITSGKFDNKNDKGEITHFQALCAALSATIGLGNISGVAVAIASGGPGAVFWMWVAALIGMATKFSSISLAMLFRTYDKEGNIHGGPMYTIKNGLPKAMYPLAISYAVFTIFGAIGVGNMFQSNQLAAALQTTFNVPNYITGIVFTILSGFVLIGGIKRIGNVAGRLVPFMVGLYFVGAIFILISNIDRVPEMFVQIFTDAFSGTAAFGGFAGVTFREVLVIGIRRAIFSNEAGLGSAAMAHAAAKSNPIQEGIVGMLGPFIDTIVVCTITAMVLLLTGVWADTNGLEGANLTAHAFGQVFGKGGVWLVTFTVVAFAFSSIISWSYYGEQGVSFLFGTKGIKPYRYIFTIFVFFGSLTKLTALLDFSDAVLGLMAIPNIIACLYLLPHLKKALKEYETSFDNSQNKGS